jgi:hypothetical protein
VNVDTDTDVLFRSLPAQETLQPEALMAYLRQAQPEIHHLSEPPSVSQFYELSCGTFTGCLLTEEDGPRNVTEPNTAAMFLEEFHAWNERHDYNRPYLGAESESGAQNDWHGIRSMSSLISVSIIDTAFHLVLTSSNSKSDPHLLRFPSKNFLLKSGIDLRVGFPILT